MAPAALPKLADIDDFWEEIILAAMEAAHDEALPLADELPRMADTGFTESALLLPEASSIFEDVSQTALAGFVFPTVL